MVMARIPELQSEANVHPASSLANITNEKQSEEKKDSAKTTLHSGLEASAPAALDPVRAPKEKEYPHGVVLGKDGNPCVDLAFLSAPSLACTLKSHCRLTWPMLRRLESAVALVPLPQTGCTWYGTPEKSPLHSRQAPVAQRQQLQFLTFKMRNVLQMLRNLAVLPGHSCIP